MNVKAIIWPTMIIGMLAVNVVIVAVTMVAAHKGGGASISPSYDERALRWDDHRREMAQSNALGWNCFAQIDRPARDAASGTLRISLTAASDQPVEATKLTIQLFHSGHPTDRTTLELVTDTQGQATAQVPASRPGYYTLHIESPAAADRAAYVHDIEVLESEPVPAGGSSQP